MFSSVDSEKEYEKQNVMAFHQGDGYVFDRDQFGGFLGMTVERNERLTTLDFDLFGYEEGQVGKICPHCVFLPLFSKTRTFGLFVWAGAIQQP